MTGPEQALLKELRRRGEELKQKIAEFVEELEKVLKRIERRKKPPP